MTVEFRGLRRVFGRTVALDGLDLTVGQGELMALLGPSGCGKTTALRCVAGFERPDAGAVFVDGKDVTRVPANRRDTGMVFQSYSLFPNLNARDNVAFGLRVRKVPAARRHARAAELLELVGLPDHGDRYPHELSGGQQQRVALARALAPEPRVLLLDEPLSALDAKVRLTLREEIRRLQLDLGITTVFVTHDQEEALSVADRVAVLRGGRLEQCGPPAEIYDRPATPFVAEFVGTMNHLPGRVTGDRVTVLGRSLPVDGPLPGSPDVDVLIRPEAVLLTPDPGGEATVVTSSFRGASARLRIRLGDLEVLGDVPGHDAVRLTPGTRVAVDLVRRPVLVAARTVPAGAAGSFGSVELGESGEPPVPREHGERGERAVPREHGEPIAATAPAASGAASGAAPARPESEDPAGVG
ncbi:putative spermidine/putrescine transport system ATP-binding protein [Streptosporangium becharense]|uniref:ABC-type quaternary amine transporter n=1 Tax=Streptosporangium becharense TaxID=1816182 RepID=A0A7W9MIW9_9ACTN|nr:ABC transporter ATP-binding protein [Streptosporangium becharense]MBB2910989.1 putative spermidine/putrescine transport system ATP-binding protein [Streptosporangium becharense]MBB5821953.1 putative spermidine/putrescine transport system ATP-binding protein [Streptosporangium becharense]